MKPGVDQCDLCVETQGLEKVAGRMMCHDCAAKSKAQMKTKASYAVEQKPQELARATARLNRVRSLRKLLEEPPEPMSYRVANLLPVGGCLMIAAPPKQGKTFFAIELSRAVATGEPFLGQFQTQKGRVLYVDEENGTVTLYDRFSKMWAGNEHGAEEAENISFLIKDGLLLDTKEGAGFLGVAVEELKPDVIILDSAVRLMSGDENHASDVRKVFESFSALLEEGVSVVILHHNSKLPKGNRTARVRGSGDWAAMLDVLLWIEKKKSGFLVGVSEHRHLDTAEFGNFHVTLKERSEGYAMVHSGVTANERSAAEKTLDVLIEWGRKNRLMDSWPRKSGRDAIMSAGHSKNSFDEALNFAEEERLIVSVGGGRWQFVPGAFPLEEEVSEK